MVVNTQIEKLFEYPRVGLLGQQIEVLVPERFQEHSTGFFADPWARATVAGVELFGLRKDGTKFPVEIGLARWRPRRECSFPLPFGTSRSGSAWNKYHKPGETAS